jgi:TP901 family phage tail tape measure protein
MPLNSRDLWLVLKAQDQTNRALSTFGRNVRNAGAQARLAQLELQRAQSQATITTAKQNAEILRSEAAQMAAQKSAIKYTAAQMAANGATQQQLKPLHDQADALDRQIIGRNNQAAALRNVAANEAINLETVKQQISQTKTYNSAIQDNEKNLAHLSGRFQSVAQTATAAGFAIAAAGVITLIGVKKAIDVSVEYERQVRATATQVEGFSGNLQQLADIGRRVARDIAVPFEQIQPALFDVFSSMDVGVADAEKLLRSFSKAAVAGQTDIQSVSRATIGILNAFHLPASDVNKILDIQFKLVQKGIGTYEEWNQRIGLVTPSAVRAGQSIEQMVAALAASTRMGISAARSAAAVSRAFDALSNPNAVKALKGLGVQVQDAQGKFRPFNEVLRDFRAVLLKMPEKDRLKTILDVFKGAGGTIEARRFLQNILLGAGNLEMFDSILKDTQHSAGAMENAYGIMSDSVAAKTQLLKNQWKLLEETVGRALIPAFTTLIGWFVNLAQWFNKLPEGTKKTIAMVVLLAGVFATVAGPILLIVGAIGSFIAAITVAGTAMLVTVAALASFVALSAAFVAGIILMYKHSENFRNGLKMFAIQFERVKEAAMDFAVSVSSAYKNHLEVPLHNLANAIESKLLPAFLQFDQMFFNKMLPKMREAGRIIADVLGQAFKFIGWVIENLVIPAINKASEWWAKNKQELEPFLSILAQVVKWLVIVAAIIIGVLVVALVGPLIAAILAVVAVVAGFIAAIVYITKIIGIVWGALKDFWGWLTSAFVTVWNAVSSAVVSAWNAIASFFVTIWNGIASFFVGIWNAITSALSSALSFIGGLWSNFWNGPISKVMIAAWGLIVDVVKLGIAAVQFVIEWALKGIQAFWSWVWNGLSSVLSSIWSGIAAFASWVWHGILGALSMIWNAIKSFAIWVFNGIASAISSAWNAVSSFVHWVWNGITGFLSSAWNTIKSIASGLWMAIKNVIGDRLNEAYNTVKGWVGKVQSFFSGAGTWLADAGRKIVQGLIDGIMGMIGKLDAAVKKLTGIITSHLPGSPVKTGPLKILNRGYAGKQITRMIADGMEAGLPYLMDRSGRVMSGISTGFDWQGQQLYTGSNAAAGPQRVINIQQTINTREISPVRQAAALGWEVQTRL